MKFYLVNDLTRRTAFDWVGFRVSFASSSSAADRCVYVSMDFMNPAASAVICHLLTRQSAYISQIDVYFRIITHRGLIHQF